MNRYILTEDEELNLMLTINNERDIEGDAPDGVDPYVGKTLDQLEAAWSNPNDDLGFPESVRREVLRLINRQRIIERNSN